jgi:hypothetical protein
MGKSAVNLDKAVKQYMKNMLTDYTLIDDKKMPYYNDYMIFGGDGAWKNNNSNYKYFFIEQKSLHEATDYNNSWWNWNSKKANNCKGHYNLSGYRSLIAHIFGIDPTVDTTKEVRQAYKWMQVIAQLRHDILNLDHSRIEYRTAFAMPTQELELFQLCFKRFTSSYVLNPFRFKMNIGLVVWNDTFNYEDSKYGDVNSSVVEIDCINYFSPKF